MFDLDQAVARVDEPKLAACLLQPPYQPLREAVHGLVDYQRARENRLATGHQVAEAGHDLTEAQARLEAARPAYEVAKTRRQQAQARLDEARQQVAAADRPVTSAAGNAGHRVVEQRKAQAHAAYLAAIQAELAAHERREQAGKQYRQARMREVQLLSQPEESTDRAIARQQRQAAEAALREATDQLGQAESKRQETEIEYQAAESVYQQAQGGGELEISPDSLASPAAQSRLREAEQQLQVAQAEYGQATEQFEPIASACQALSGQIQATRQRQKAAKQAQEKAERAEAAAYQSFQERLAALGGRSAPDDPPSPEPTILAARLAEILPIQPTLTGDPQAGIEPALTGLPRPVQSTPAATARNTQPSAPAASSEPAASPQPSAPANPLAALANEIRQAARLAFADRTLDKAERLLRQAGARYPRLGVAHLEWRRLWSDPAAPLQLRNVDSSTHALTSLADSLKLAADLARLLHRVLALRPHDNQIAQAQTDLAQLTRWKGDDRRVLLPDSLWRIPFDLAYSLANARIAWSQGEAHWGQALQTFAEGPYPASYTPLLTPVRQAYTEAVWQRLLNYTPNGQRSEVFALFAKDSKPAPWLQQQPWYPAAQALKQAYDAYERGEPLTAVEHALKLPVPNGLSPEQRRQLRTVQGWYIEAARAYALALARQPAAASIDPLQDKIMAVEPLAQDELGLAPVPPLLRAVRAYRRQNWGAAAHYMVAAYERCQANTLPGYGQAVLQVAQEVYFHNWLGNLHLWQRLRLRHRLSVAEAAHRLQPIGVGWAGEVVENLRRNEAALTREKRLLAGGVAGLIVILGAALLLGQSHTPIACCPPNSATATARVATVPAISPLATPTLPRTAMLPPTLTLVGATRTSLPAPSRPSSSVPRWSGPAFPGDASPPLPAGAAVLTQVNLRELGIPDGGGFYRLNQFFFRQPWNSDTAVAVFSLSGRDVLTSTGLLPGQPLFLFTDQIREPARFSPGGVAAWTMPVPWGPPGNTITATLPFAINDTRSKLEQWRSDPQGGWLWLLAESPGLERAITACRNAKAGLSGAECDTQNGLLAGTRPLSVTAQVVMGLSAAGSLTPIAANPPALIHDRWVYADLGPYGVSAALPPDVRDLVARQGGGLGLVRGEWQPDRAIFSPNLILGRRADGVYRLLWKNF